jgi:5-formyltetrahydrofolate cyclo-ligase
MYLAFDGELDTAPMIGLARAHGCHVFVPVIQSHRASSMEFVPLGAPMRTNRFGTPEPASGHEKRISPRFLDLVIVPVVAFGASGERLGSGSGYYDRAFAYLHARCAWHKPLLVGVAYEWQRAADLASQPWDVALAAVVTDRAIHTFGPSILRARDRR